MLFEIELEDIFESDNEKDKDSFLYYLNSTFKKNEIIDEGIIKIKKA